MGFPSFHQKVFLFQFKEQDSSHFERFHDYVELPRNQLVCENLDQIQIAEDQMMNLDGQLI